MVAVMATEDLIILAHIMVMATQEFTMLLQDIILTMIITAEVAEITEAITVAIAREGIAEAVEDKI